MSTPATSSPPTPPPPQATYVTHKCRGFVGREWLFDAVASMPRGHVLSIVGPAGVGKTAFAAALVTRAAEFGVTDHHFCRFNDMTTLRSPPWLPKNNWTAWARSLTAPQGQEEGPKTLVVVDALDEAPRALTDNLLAAAMSRAFPPNVRVVVTSRLPLDDEVPGVVTQVDLSLDRRESLQDLVAWVKTLDVPSETAEWLIACSDGQFAFVEAAMSEGLFYCKEAMATGEALLAMAGAQYSARGEAVWTSRTWQQDMDLVAMACAVFPHALEDWMIGSHSLDRLRLFLTAERRIVHRSWQEWALEDGLYEMRAQLAQGHQALALRGFELWKSNDSVCACLVRHVLRSGHTGLAARAAEEVVMKWEWMRTKAAFDGNWVDVAEEAIEIGGPSEEVGRVIRHHSRGSEEDLLRGLSRALPGLEGAEELLHSVQSEFTEAYPVLAPPPWLYTWDQQLYGHQRVVLNIVGMDGNRIATRSRDGTLMIWDGCAGTVVDTIANQVTRGVSCLDITPDGASVLSIRWGGPATLYDIDNQTHTPWGRAYKPGLFARILDDRTMVSVSSNGLETWSRPKAVDGEQQSAREWRRSAKGKPGELDVSEVYDMVTWTNNEGVSFVAIAQEHSPASFASRNRILVFDIDGWKRVSVLHGHTGVISCLAVLPDGRIASGSADKTLRFWSFKRRTRYVQTLAGSWGLGPLVRRASQRVQKISTGQWVRALQVMPDYKTLAAAQGSAIRMWDIETRTCVGIVRGHRDAVECLGVLTDGRLLSGSRDNTAMVWNKHDSVLKPTPGDETLDNLSLSCAIVLRDGRIATGCLTDSLVRVYQAPVDGTRPELDSVLDGYSTNVRTLCEVGSGLVAGGSSVNMMLWRTSKGNAGWTKGLTMTGHEYWVAMLCTMKGDSNTLVSATYDASLKVWDMSVTRGTPKSQHRIKLAHGTNRPRAMIALDRDTVLVSHETGVTAAYSVRTGTQLWFIRLAPPAPDGQMNADQARISSMLVVSRPPGLLVMEDPEHVLVWRDMEKPREPGVVIAEIGSPMVLEAEVRPGVILARRSETLNGRTETVVEELELNRAGTRLKRVEPVTRVPHVVAGVLWQPDLRRMIVLDRLGLSGYRKSEWEMMSMGQSIRTSFSSSDSEASDGNRV